MTDDNKFVLPEIKSFTNTWHNAPYSAINPLRPELSASGRHVVVTGAGTGIGKAIAIAFAEAGAASVSILGRRIDRLEQSASEIKAKASNKNIQVLTKSTDLMDRKSTEDAFSYTASKVGKISVLVANAGALGNLGPLKDCDPDIFMKSFNMNVLTVMNTVQAFIPHATETPFVLHVSTGLVHMPPMANMSAYTVSKLAALKMMDNFASENPWLHIVNIQPGGVSTEANKDLPYEPPDDARLPGQFCVWLTSSEARFLKGKFAWANWDIGELLAKADEIANSSVLSLGLQGVPM